MKVWFLRLIYSSAMDTIQEAQFCFLVLFERMVLLTCLSGEIINTYILSEFVFLLHNR